MARASRVPPAARMSPARTMAGGSEHNRSPRADGQTLGDLAHRLGRGTVPSVCSGDRPAQADHRVASPEAGVDKTRRSRAPARI
jgi:hypothetical protein